VEYRISKVTIVNHVFAIPKNKCVRTLKYFKYLPRAERGSKNSSSSNDKKSSEKTADDNAAEMQQRIQRILASQWDSRLRKVENKFVKTGSRVGSAGGGGGEDALQTTPKKPLLRESKLELNRGLLERLRAPSQQGRRSLTNSSTNKGLFFIFCVNLEYLV
jgi:hypothetical protein